MRKCKVCRKKFTPRFSTLQSTCEDPSCVLSWAKKNTEKNRKKEMKIMKDKVKRVSDWKRDLRIIFHRYIRLRDKDLPCISCGNKLGEKYDAGHFYSRGAFPNLAFDPMNVHAQCVRCNQWLSGNLIEYSSNLPRRIGHHEFNLLRERRNLRASLSISEIQSLIAHYKQSIKSISNELH